jgi:predicted transcriptional regulator
MSIRPQYAEAILAGTKRIEFRKRRLADDISAVVVYSTLPIGQIVGAFSVLTCEVASPTALWEKHRHHAGIARDAYRDYYRGNSTAVGILIDQALALDAPVPLPEAWPAVRPPQSLTYLPPAPTLMETMTRLFPPSPPALAPAQPTP